MLKQGVLINETRDFAQKLLSEKLPKEYVYHSLQHTIDVAAAVREIGENCDLSELDLETVEMAAWLHDIGYVISKDDHEEKSIELATEFLKDRNVDPRRIEKINGCIRATRMPQSPNNLLEEIICDADLIHLATDKYSETAEKLKEEMEFTKDLILTDKEWMEMNLQFFGEQEYFT